MLLIVGGYLLQGFASNHKHDGFQESKASGIKDKMISICNLDFDQKTRISPFSSWMKMMMLITRYTDYL